MSITSLYAGGDSKPFKKEWLRKDYQFTDQERSSLQQQFVQAAARDFTFKALARDGNQQSGSIAEKPHELTPLLQHKKS